MYAKKDIKWVLAWTVPSLAQPIITFLAFNNLPVGLVFYLMYAAVTLSAFIGSYIFFKEKLNLEKIASLILVVLGITFIYGTNISFVTNIYVIFALLSGALIGLWNIMTKKLSGKYSEEQMVLTDNLSAFTFCLVLSLMNHDTLPALTNYHAWIWMIIFAITTLSTSVLIVRGFNKVEAQVGSLIVPMEIVFGSIVGYLFLGETLSTSLYIGGAFILLASILPYLVDVFRSKK